MLNLRAVTRVCSQRTIAERAVVMFVRVEPFVRERAFYLLRRWLCYKWNRSSPCLAKFFGPC